MVFRVASGAIIQLGDQVGRGGEGSVFAVRGDGSRVAKIYHAADPNNEMKLKSMIK